MPLSYDHALVRVRSFGIRNNGHQHTPIGRVVPTSTRQEPSTFELPSRSVSPVLALARRLYRGNSGLSRLQNWYQDTYEPGTQGRGAYIPCLSPICRTDSAVATATATNELLERDVTEVDSDTIKESIFSVAARSKNSDM